MPVDRALRRSATEAGKRIGTAADGAAGPGADRATRQGALVALLEFLGHDVLLTIDPAGDTGPIIVRQHSLNPPAIDAKVRIEVVGTGVALR